MSALNEHHKTLNEFGEGKCSVPMYVNGSPSGFCDERAFGERPYSPERMNYCTGRMMRDDNRYDGYVPGLACVCHGGPRVRTFMDGNMWCAVHSNFVDLQESESGWGTTKDEAIRALKSAPPEKPAV